MLNTAVYLSGQGHKIMQTPVCQFLGKREDVFVTFE